LQDGLRIWKLSTAHQPGTIKLEQPSARLLLAAATQLQHCLGRSSLVAPPMRTQTHTVYLLSSWRPKDHATRATSAPHKQLAALVALFLWAKELVQDIDDLLTATTTCHG
jgi:hypothetical protein